MTDMILFLSNKILIEIQIRTLPTSEIGILCSGNYLQLKAKQVFKKKSYFSQIMIHNFIDRNI